MVGMVLLGVAGVAVVIIAVLVFRGRSETGAGDSPLWRAGPDGFFILGNYTPGTPIQYEYFVSGEWRGGTVPAAGLETFVYTGTPPVDVRFGDAELVSSGFMPVPSIGSGPASVDDDDDVNVGSPSAY